MAETAMPTLADLGMKVGDMVTVPILEKRRWWQLWKPKYGPPKPATYLITAVTSSTITNLGG